MLSWSWKLVWPENENTVNLKNASFIIIMLLNERLARVQEDKKARKVSGRCVYWGNWVSEAKINKLFLIRGFPLCLDYLIHQHM